MYAHASSRVVDRNNKQDLGRMGSEADKYHRGVREKKNTVQQQDQNEKVLA